jgi:hypothetical protein
MMPGSARIRLSRAGTELFWSLTIDERRMVFTEANAPGTEIVQSTLRVIVGIAGVYRRRGSA